MSNEPYLFTLKGSYLTPNDPKTEEMLCGSFKQNALIRADKLKAARSTRNNAHYWVSLSKLAKAYNRTSENFHNELKMACGLTQFIKVGGETYLIPDSTSFQKIQEGEFVDFRQKAEAYLAQQYGIDLIELMGE